jgi:GTP-binding protein EngB required for normal cell division
LVLVDLPGYSYLGYQETENCFINSLYNYFGKKREQCMCFCFGDIRLKHKNRFGTHYLFGKTEVPFA